MTERTEATRAWRRILDETDWPGLSHAYGPASDTPAHLRAFLVGSEDDRKAAACHLVSAIIHQGTPWPATFPATAVVLGMCQDGDVATAIQPSRQDLLRFLDEIDDALDQFTDSDWASLETMAAGVASADNRIDWTAIEDEDVLNAHFARTGLDLRTLRPEIRACLGR